MVWSDIFGSFLCVVEHFSLCEWIRRQIRMNELSSWTFRPKHKWRWESTLRYLLLFGKYFCVFLLVLLSVWPALHLFWFQLIILLLCSHNHLLLINYHLLCGLPRWCYVLILQVVFSPFICNSDNPCPLTLVFWHKAALILGSLHLQHLMLYKFNHIVFSFLSVCIWANLLQIGKMCYGTLTTRCLETTS